MSASQLYITRSGGEEALLAELGRVYPHSRHTKRAELLVSSELIREDTKKRPILAFASQVLHAPVSISFDSIREAAEQVFDTLASEELTHPWILHIYPLTRGYTPAGERRAELVEEAFVEILKKRRRSWLKSRVSECRRGAALAWLQCVLTGPNDAFVSYVGERDARRLRHVLSEFPAGYVRVPEDKRPPSTAYRKLREALMRFGRTIEPGADCVDLGASPGGWTYVAAQLGANVTAVDRSPLRADLMKHPKVRFINGDAFKYTPPHPCDWLLSDVIAYPERIIGLVDTWVGEGRCRNFCVTIKFKGDADYPVLERMKSFLEEVCTDFLLVQLSSNKNEVTAIGTSKFKDGKEKFSGRS